MASIFGSVGSPLGWTPLLLAARYATKDTVEYLVGMKANIEAKNKYGTLHGNSDSSK